jgi:hypothetical protein
MAVTQVPRKKPKRVGEFRKFIFTHDRAPGDTLVLTGFLRDLKLTYGDKVQFDCRVSAPDLLRHNPHITELRKTKRKVDIQTLALDYGRGIKAQNHETIHFLSEFHRDFERHTGLHVPVVHPYPDLHLSQEERDTPLVAGRYWVIISGGKDDFTIKVWGTEYFQRVVDVLRARGISIVQIGSTDTGHWHPRLPGTLNMVGMTNLRDTMRLIHHSDGVICGVTMAMHMAAALHRPCVVLAGGREAWWWEAYVNENTGFGERANGKVPVPHRFLHTIGLLDCCKTHGCWKNKIVSLPAKRAGRKPDVSLCKLREDIGTQPVAACMKLIKPEHVIEAVMSYYADDTLPPIQPITPAQPTATTASSTPLIDVFGSPVAPVAAATVLAPEPTLAAVPTVTNAPEGRGRTVVRIPSTPTERVELINDMSVMDDTIIGGKITLFVLLYGDFTKMHLECLTAIKQTVPKERLDLRIGSNELCAASVKFVQQMETDGWVTHHYRNLDNRKKYPVMRDMFHDPDFPITTKWLLWFDDDTLCNRDPNWLPLMCRRLVDTWKDGVRMAGPKRFFSLSPSQVNWVKEASWYKGRDFIAAGGRPAPNGRKVVFASGSLWALHVDTMRECDIPDARIGHNGGDYMIGAQLLQGGHGFTGFSSHKQHVNWSAYARRGLDEAHAGKAAK